MPSIETGSFFTQQYVQFKHCQMWLAEILQSAGPATHQIHIITIPNHSSSPHPAAGFQCVTRRKGFASAASPGSICFVLTMLAVESPAAPLRSREWFCLAAAGIAGGGHGGRGCSPASAVAGSFRGQLLWSRGLQEPLGLV